MGAHCIHRQQRATGTLAAERVDALPLHRQRGGAVNHPDYDARAVQADEQAMQRINQTATRCYKPLYARCVDIDFLAPRQTIFR
jgi:hypothetical protein